MATARVMAGDGFKICSGHGFHMRVNGWVFSVQFGTGNYCANRGKDEGVGAGEEWVLVNQKLYFRPMECGDAEVALWRDVPAGEEASLEQMTNGDTVCGGVSAVQVAWILGVLSNPGYGYEAVMGRVKMILSGGSQK